MFFVKSAPFLFYWSFRHDSKCLRQDYLHIFKRRHLWSSHMHYREKWRRFRHTMAHHFWMKIYEKNLKCEVSIKVAFFYFVTPCSACQDFWNAMSTMNTSSIRWSIQHLSYACVNGAIFHRPVLIFCCIFAQKWAITHIKWRHFEYNAPNHNPTCLGEANTPQHHSVTFSRV